MPAYRKLAPYLKSQGSKKFRVNVVLQGDPYGFDCFPDRDNRRHARSLTYTTHNSGTGKKKLAHRYHHERGVNHPVLDSLSERYNVDVWVSQTDVVCFRLPLFLIVSVVL